MAEVGETFQTVPAFVIVSVDSNGLAVLLSSLEASVVYTARGLATLSRPPDHISTSEALTWQEAHTQDSLVTNAETLDGIQRASGGVKVESTPGRSWCTWPATTT